MLPVPRSGQPCENCGRLPSGPTTALVDPSLRQYDGRNRERSARRRAIARRAAPMAQPQTQRTHEQLLLDLERQICSSTHIDTHARVLANLGFCSRKMGKVESAIQYYDCASALLDDLGARTETVRIRWNVAVMLAEAGRVADACARLRDVTREMELLGMTSEVAIAGLDVAELLLAQSRYDEVSDICRSAMQSFENAGLAYTARALTALAYIQEAAQLRRADQTLVRTVRDYIRRLPAQPQLLFAPPPPS